MSERQFLEVLRGAIAMKSIPKKNLARDCGISRPYFSEMIHGDRPMPESIKSKLVSKLGLDRWERRLAILEGDQT